MSFPKYSKYRASGVEWLGEVPEHWRASRFQRCVDVAEGQVDPETSNFSNMPLIAPNHVESGTGRLLDLETAADQGAESGKYLCRAGDVVYSKIRPALRKVCIAPEDCLCSADMYPLRSHSGLTNRFLFWLILSEQFSAVAVLESGRVAMPKINRESLKAIGLAIPPVDEQTMIANALDRETQKIDALVSEQQRLIELLQEKRQAVISHAVTKGLNPDVPMKASGIEWLGDVPQHWSVSKAKRVASVFVPQRNKPELNDSGNGVCWITMEQMQNPEILDSPLYVSEEASANAGSKVLKSGAVIASCVGQFEVATINRVDVIINQQLQAYIPGPDINPEYLRLLILLSTSYFEQTGTAATIVYVNQKGFDELPVAVPPMGEQRAIVDYLDVQSGTLSRLQTEAVRAIELLRERRTALISAAVTGKIDVRGLAGKASA